MPKSAYNGPLERVNDNCWRIPKSYKQGMRVDGLIYASEALLEHIRNDPGSGTGRQTWPRCRAFRWPASSCLIFIGATGFRSAAFAPLTPTKGE